MISASEHKGIVDVPGDFKRLIAGSETAIALFLDLDGTLIDIAETPDVVIVPEELPGLLDRASRALGGALAIVSGRPLDDIDRLTAPVRLPAAGIHGGEIRYAAQDVARVPAPAAMGPLRTRIFEKMTAIPGVLIEDKGVSIAVHFRQAARQAQAVHEGLLDVIALQADRFRVLPGKMVFEVMPRVFRKDVAITAFMDRAPFRGRVPVFVGDDRSDDDAIAEAVRRGGFGLRVGAGVDDGMDFPGPAAVRRWIAELPALIAHDISSVQ